ncbi:MAG: sigma-70 family RNA polymerase sigma factor [Verrucomicrobiae bacterium]|nr:sigma-70 family RNA polymerase sigma factor [Verrucomicrobiae bacterium]
MSDFPRVGYYMGEMQSESDAQLLRAYVEHGTEAAFTELVHRYTNLVYSAALRQVGSPAAAGEVAQGVFLGLAHGAQSLLPRLTAEASLAGWLCRSARNLSLNHRRDEFRRLTRERQAMEQLISIPDDAPEWEHLRPVLDEAMAELDETDYDALVLRFFQQRDYRAVGSALGISDDTAQKRVTRALEKLRDLLSQRGIRATAAALSVVIAANAVQAAPAGLAATIATATLTGTAVTASTIIAATKTIAMTTFQKALVAATVTLLAGAGLYETHQAAQLRGQNRALQQQQMTLAGELQQLQREQAAATNRLAEPYTAMAGTRTTTNQTELLKLRGEIAVLQNAANDPAAVAVRDWVAKVNKLKQRLADTPDSKIPELQFLTEQDWLNAARGRLDSDADYRRALATLRGAAENKVANMLKKALSGFMKNADAQFPTDLSQLQPYFDSPMDEAVLQRWEITPASTIKNLGMGGNSIITQKAPVDDVFDTRYGIGPNGFGSTDFMQADNYKTMQPVYDAYRAAHNDQWQTSLSELQPYVTTPEQQTALGKLMLRESARDGN